MLEPGAPKVALVTGATRGLGRCVSVRLAQAGYQVFLHGREPEACRDVVREIRSLGGPEPIACTASFTSLASVAELCRTVLARTDRLHLLVNNAGTGFNGPEPLTEDGYGPVFQVNYLAPYLLTRGLLPLLAQTPGSVVVNVASTGQATFEVPVTGDAEVREGIAYGRSKLAMIMATATLGEQHRGRSPALIAVHPGSLLDTNLSHRLLARLPRLVRAGLLFSRPLGSVDGAADFVVEEALRPDAQERSGSFQCRRGPGRVKRQGGDRRAREALEAFSQDAVRPFIADRGKAVRSIEHELSVGQ